MSFAGTLAYVANSNWNKTADRTMYSKAYSTLELTTITTHNQSVRTHQHNVHTQPVSLYTNSDRTTTNSNTD